MKWKAKLPAESPAEEDQLPSRKWKVKQVPSSARSAVLSAEDEEIIAEERDVSEGSVDDVPIVKWKAAVPVDDDASPPMVKWKAKMPAETQGSDDVPVVRRKAKMPEETHGSDDIPVVQRKAKIPEETHGSSDVPVVKWKAKMPTETQGSDDVRWKAKMPVETQGSDDVPVVRWKAKMPAETQGSDDVPVVRRKAKMPAETQGSDDVPVVRRKAKMPAETQGSDDVPVVRRKAKMPAETQGSDDVPVVRRKAKMPAETQGSDDVPVVRRKAKVPQGSDGWKVKMPAETHGSDNVSVPRRKAKLPEDPRYSDVGKLKAKMPQNVKSGTTMLPRSDDVPVVKSKASTNDGPNPQRHRKIAKMPVDDYSSSEGTPSHSTSHLVSSPPHSPVISPSHTPRKSLSRRSSFSESRSPSPPSISPHVRRAIASPILSRRTPSPSRGLVGSLNARVSPGASPVLQQKHLHYISSNHQSPATGTSPSRSFTSGITSSGPTGHMSRIRTPRSQSTGKVKTSSPLKGLTPPGERKHKRTLPMGPPDVTTGGQQFTPTSNKK